MSRRTFLAYSVDRNLTHSGACSDSHFAKWSVRELSDEEAVPFQREIDKLPKGSEAAAIQAIELIGQLAKAIARCPSTPAVQEALRELGDDDDFRRLIEAAQ